MCVCVCVCELVVGRVVGGISSNIVFGGGMAHTWVDGSGIYCCNLFQSFPGATIFTPL